MDAPAGHFPSPAEQAPLVFEKIAIVGLGLIGGSIALAVRQLWPGTSLIAVDRDEVLDNALRRGAVDVASGELLALADADLIVLAAPVQQNIEILGRLPAVIDKAVLITDTGSTKRDIASAARQLPDRLTFVGGHPLGGAADSGFDHARADLFRGRPWIFTPPARPQPDAEARLAALVRAFGAVPRTLDPLAHDRLLAFVSHLPQITSSALMQVVGLAVGADDLSVAGRGLMDTTRLAGSSAELWKQIVASNADEIAPALDALIATLQALRDDLPAGQTLATVFDEASRWRRALTARTPL